jgi:hypothetical protein
MKIIATLIVFIAASMAYYSFQLFQFIESTHGASAFNNGFMRIRLALRQDEQLSSIATNLIRDIWTTYNWLSTSLLVLVISSIVLLGVGVVMFIMASKSRKRRCEVSANMVAAPGETIL